MQPIHGAIAGPLARQVAQLRQINALLRDCLPADCCDHCQAARLDNGTLHLVADSPAWRSRLHFYAPRVIRHFNRSEQCSIQRIQIRVGRTPAAPAPPGYRPGPSPMPAATARAFAALAQEVDDPYLRRALNDLAGHGPSSE